MYSLPALYMLQYVPIVTYSCKFRYSKKKKKKRKKTCTSIWVKKYQSYATKTPLSIFSLGKGREFLRLQTLHKKLSKSVLSTLLPSMQKHSDSDTVWMMHAKIDQN